LLILTQRREDAKKYMMALGTRRVMARNAANEVDAQIADLCRTNVWNLVF